MAHSLSRSAISLEFIDGETQVTINPLSATSDQYCWFRFELELTEPGTDFLANLDFDTRLVVKQAGQPERYWTRLYSRKMSSETNRMECQFLLL